MIIFALRSSFQEMIAYCWTYSTSMQATLCLEFYGSSFYRIHVWFMAPAAALEWSRNLSGAVVLILWSRPERKVWRSAFSSGTGLSIPTYSRRSTPKNIRACLKTPLFNPWAHFYKTHYLVYCQCSSDPMMMIERLIDVLSFFFSFFLFRKLQKIRQS